MSMPYYEELDWPSVPQHLCDLAISSTKEAENIWEFKDRFPDFAQHIVPDELLDWLNTNLPIDLTDYTIRLQSMRTSTMIHKDITRKFSYNFVMTNDGGITSWYDMEESVVPYGTIVPMLETVKYESMKWYKNASKIAHDVRGIESPPRVAITIFKHL